MGSVLQVNPTTLVPIGGIGEEALRLGINNTKTFIMVGITNIHLVRTLDTLITIEDC
ncbi:hypothetical protein Patl1_29678 [Pistacia atlantica]|uniref:Uncharacterized protein n=1 Tax=Pistacia atlantica TaxID=434234 RepID=A0ACC1AE82_9ROSI|nr:hypothetical protein Patl1_37662 [Pistacia atlantica]KAJ0084328.1 hypothetical protein Patl1_29678 [Pistacia atlantica]